MAGDGAVLKGITVLDLSMYMAGPYCTTLLADMGAEVIRAEMPTGAADREQGPVFADQNLRFWLVGRNKKGITLNLSRPEGKELLHRLVEKCDVFVNSYILPVRAKLGLKYEDLVQVNPAIIQVDVTGFGDTGPYADRPCFDHLAQAESGVMSYAGFKGNPPVRWPVPWIDMGTGLMAAYGTVLALYHRERAGAGQRIEASLFETAISGVSFNGHSVACEVLGDIRPQMGNAGYYTFSDTFTAKDGVVFLDATSDRLWRRFTGVIGHPELVDDLRFETDTLRYQNRDFLVPIVQAWVGDKTVDEVCGIMQDSNLPFARVASIEDVMNHPQVRAQRMFVDMMIQGAGNLPHPRLPIDLSGTPPQIISPAPTVGEHNEYVYGEMLGLSGDEIERLRLEGII